MDFDTTNIGYKECPTCGSELTSYKQYSKHTNGNWNEDVEFRCGHKIHFSPNFMRIEEKEGCPESRQAKIQRIQKDAAQKQLDKFLKKWDIPEQQKEKAEYELNYLLRVAYGR